MKKNSTIALALFALLLWLIGLILVFDGKLIVGAFLGCASTIIAIWTGIHFISRHCPE